MVWASYPALLVAFAQYCHLLFLASPRCEYGILSRLLGLVEVGLFEVGAAGVLVLIVGTPKYPGAAPIGMCELVAPPALAVL